ncbi:MAG: hypothetical protein FWG48_06445 [Oscillospiraceae bacterium]|nr:hypothetical protein [Oscillospiraceae bacterium]
MNKDLLTVNIIMAVCIYPLMPIMYFILKNSAKAKKNLMLGVTLPFDARQDARVLALCDEFKRRLRAVCLILAVIPVSCFFTGYMSISLTIQMTWILVAVVVPYAIYAVYHTRLKMLKQENKWFGETQGAALLDTRVSFSAMKRVNAWLYVPPVLASIVPVAVGVATRAEGAMMAMYVTDAVLTAGISLLHKILYRQRAEVIDSNTSLSRALSDIRRHYWEMTFLWLTWSTGVFSLLIWLLINGSMGIIILSVAYVAVVLISAMSAEFRARKAQEKLTAESGRDKFVDLDRYWMLGLFYYNPADKHFMVNDRIGVGTSVNLARPAAMVLMAFAVVCMLAMPAFGVWMMSEEFTAPYVEVSESAIMAYHTGLEYRVDFADISSVGLLGEMPASKRVAGTGFTALLKGRFNASGIGPCRLCLNPKVPPFIVIVTDETTYIFGSGSADETLATFERLSKSVD